MEEQILITEELIAKIPAFKKGAGKEYNFITLSPKFYLYCNFFKSGIEVGIAGKTEDEDELSEDLDIKYLHELKAFYFGWTKEELVVNL